MARTLRYGLIGTGLMGFEHIRNIALLPDARVTALADPHPDSRELGTRAVGHPVQVVFGHHPCGDLDHHHEPGEQDDPPGSLLSFADYVLSERVIMICAFC